nr:mitochondrial import receptor subunit TOM9-2-like [Setaria viridis]
MVSGNELIAMASAFAESVSESSAAAVGEAAEVARKLVRSVGKAAWLAGTTFLVLGLPLMWALDREMQENEAELSRQSILGGTDLYR